jgi:UDP-N-acetylglucosamine:LPS N-acetylglucosamine transferase
MAPHISGFAPDVIISTYPLGSAGLSWLRRHRGLGVPAGAWVPAFFPHPYWLYPNLDVTYVMHPDLVPVASQAEPGTRLRVGALPVRDVFAPGDRAAARCRLGLDAGRFIAVICTGSLGFGKLDDVVTAVLAVGPEVQAVVICGHNERLRRQLTARGEPRVRLRVVGWTGDMPSWMTAADVVVANAGGATALEAMACAVPLIMFDPIAGHGRANAEHMAAAGVALLPRSPSELTAAIARLAADPAARAGLDRTVTAGRGNRRREDDLAELAAMPGRDPHLLQPVRARDALFAYVHTEGVPQQVGAVVRLNGPNLDLPTLRSLVAERAGPGPSASTVRAAAHGVSSPRSASMRGR